MKKSRFTETQIVSILKEVDAGMKVEEICRKHGISNGSAIPLPLSHWMDKPRLLPPLGHATLLIRLKPSSWKPA